ncbi:hypothetical protein [Micromonospora sp. DT47]|uniref:hypothetical protein n=1 Tax=Micromonospora sp. DT47 TaxID=3393431 RepID=UPI003CE96F6F
MAVSSRQDPDEGLDQEIPSRDPLIRWGHARSCGTLRAMALTGPATADSATPQSAAEDAGTGGVGRIVGWVQTDPVRAVAALLIVIGLAWRAQIASRGYLAQDDFILAARAAGSELTVDFLLSQFNNHLMPAGLLAAWLITRATGLAYWPYVLLLLTGQALLSVAFYRLLRLLIRPGWGLLVPLCVLLFSPLTLEVTSMVTTGLRLLPMQLAMVLAIAAQVKYVRTRRIRHLLTVALSVLLGLLFSEQSLLIVPLVFLLTACLFVTGGPVRSIIRTIRRYWPSWVVLTVLSLAYLGLYLSRAQSPLPESRSADAVLTFVGHLIGYTLLPGLLGGPWHWMDASDGTAAAAPHVSARWLAGAVFLALIVVTVRLRRSAIRAWVLLAAYLALVAALLAATRLGLGLSAVMGLVPRLVSDVVVVAALCIGVALLGLANPAGETLARSWTWPVALRGRRALVGALVVALAAASGTAWSGSQFADDWAVKQGRDYLHTAQAELSKAPPGTVFFDQPVPEGVVAALSRPYNLQSHFFRPIQPQPVFVTEAETLWMFDEAGHIRLARVAGTAIEPGPEGVWGHCVDGGQTVRMPLTKPLNNEWERAVRIAYISTGDSPAVLRHGGATREFQVRGGGVRQVFLVMGGGGDTVELTITDRTVRLCTNEITLGSLVPEP